MIGLHNPFICKLFINKPVRHLTSGIFEIIIYTEISTEE